MARLLRVDRPSLWYHLTARGNALGLSRYIHLNPARVRHLALDKAVAARRFRRRLETDRRLRALAEEAESYLSNVQS